MESIWIGDDDEPIYYFRNRDGYYSQYGLYPRSHPPPLAAKSKEIFSFAIDHDSNCYAILGRGILADQDRHVWVAGDVETERGKKNVVLLPPIVCKFSKEYPHVRAEYIKEVKDKLRAGILNTGYFDPSVGDKLGEMIDERAKILTGGDHPLVMEQLISFMLL
ncbi:hypothetical protein OROHE_027056 [Orobanche hederae]